jgi:hypothetical protein
VSDFFGELAKQLAGQWLSLLAIPGTLFFTAGWIGLQLHQGHALDAHDLAESVASTATEIAHWPTATQALALGALLLASAAVGLVVQALVGPVRALILGQWLGRPGRLGRSLTTRRRNRWNQLVKERATLEVAHPQHNRTIEQQHQIDRLAGQIIQIAMAEPGRPTWMGDRIHALTQIAINRYGLDLTFGWPRLWLILPDTARVEINTAQAGFATTLTELTEAAVDVYGRELAIALGVASRTSTGPLTPDEGQHITDIARKGR